MLQIYFRSKSSRLIHDADPLKFVAQERILNTCMSMVYRC